jgi:hypothetical protein
MSLPERLGKGERERLLDLQDGGSGGGGGASMPIGKVTASAVLSACVPLFGSLQFGMYLTYTSEWWRAALLLLDCCTVDPISCRCYRGKSS